jgi:hypothetical protein
LVAIALTRISAALTLVAIALTRISAALALVPIALTLTWVEWRNLTISGAIALTIPVYGSLRTELLNLLRVRVILGNVQEGQRHRGQLGSSSPALNVCCGVGHSNFQLNQAGSNVIAEGTRSTLELLSLVDIILVCLPRVGVKPIVDEFDDLLCALLAVEPGAAVGSFSNFLPGLEELAVIVREVLVVRVSSGLVALRASTRCDGVLVGGLEQREDLARVLWSVKRHLSYGTCAEPQQGEELEGVQHFGCGYED